MTAAVAPGAANTAAAARTALLRLYRILQRQCVAFQKELPRPVLVEHNGKEEQGTTAGGGQQQFLFVHPPVEPHERGAARHFRMPPPAVLVGTGTGGDPPPVSGLLRLLRANDGGEEDATLNEWLETLTETDDESEEAYGSPGGMRSSVWTNVETIQATIRYAFRQNAADPVFAGMDGPMRTRWAIRAYQLLQEQSQTQRRTSVSRQGDVRIVATSRFIGREAGGAHGGGYHYGYRIRIENLAQQRHQEQEQQGRGDDIPDEEDSSASSDTPSDTIQLLGRTWVIQSHDTGEEPIRVHAPTTGVVGHLPVLDPGDAFEYASYTELSTPSGTMAGCLHFARVPPHSPSQEVGMHVAAFDSANRFEVPIRPFALEAPAAAT